MAFRTAPSETKAFFGVSFCCDRVYGVVVYFHGLSDRRVCRRDNRLMSLEKQATQYRNGDEYKANFTV